MSTQDVEQTQWESNDEAIAAWDGPLFDRWRWLMGLTLPWLQRFSERAFELVPPQPGWHVLDIGVGLGDTTVRLAELVGPEGRALGLDAAPRMIEAAREDNAGSPAEFVVHDMQEPLDEGPFDAAYARFGTMFFANPVAALRNVAAILRPGAPLTMVVWRRREDNTFLYEAQQIVEGMIGRPEEYDEPTCGPGPFSMSNADTVTAQCLAAGFTDVATHRVDRPMLIGRSVDEAIDMVTAIGPAGELIRLWGDRMAHRHDEIRAALAAAMEARRTDEGVIGQASCWVVTATRP
ncbi:MAG TPA: class I SAM-dependent methyltransferase [Baekduia sp.]|nr:class I SAM-dependent methyltransferase [Baekduia sp.]